MTEKYIDLNFIDVIYDTVVDGEGIRVSLYLSGCNHGCYNCHNPESHNLFAGKRLTYTVLEDILKYLEGNDYVSGLTISGGEPFLKPRELLKILQFFKGYKIWCYTGYLYQEVKKYKEHFEYIDVLVDGKYIDNLRAPNLGFRGSSNQKVIYIKKHSID